jgi:hypothetical protein
MLYIKKLNFLFCNDIFFLVHSALALWSKTLSIHSIAQLIADKDNAFLLGRDDTEQGLQIILIATHLVKEVTSPCTTIGYRWFVVPLLPFFFFSFFLFSLKCLISMLQIN